MKNMFAIVSAALVLLSKAASTLANVHAAECSTSASFASEGPGRPYFSPAVAGKSTVRMINLGFGTTGTRDVHREGCALGLVSCHWLHCCNAHASVVAAQTRLIYIGTSCWKNAHAARPETRPSARETP
jgi:hypothetical protein